MLSIVAEFSESVRDVYLPWVAVYLVERASIKPNLHSLYFAFLDHLADSPLDNLVLLETYRCIGLALRADLSFNVSFDRSTLKNLVIGH